MTIIRYVIVNDDGREHDYEHETLEAAIDVATCKGSAVVARTYTFDDSELVWTPDGSDTWPPDSTDSTDTVAAEGN
jgi:phage I-like protein